MSYFFVTWFPLEKWFCRKSFEEKGLQVKELEFSQPFLNVNLNHSFKWFVVSKKQMVSKI